MSPVTTISGRSKWSVDRCWYAQEFIADLTHKIDRVLIECCVVSRHVWIIVLTEISYECGPVNFLDVNFMETSEMSHYRLCLTIFVRVFVKKYLIVFKNLRFKNRVVFCICTYSLFSPQDILYILSSPACELEIEN